MPDALTLGPLLLPTMLLLLLAAIFLATLVAGRLGRRDGVDTEGVIWQSVLLAAVVARLAFVSAFAPDYLADPWRILDIRDGGWSLLAGLAAALVFALWRGWRRPALRRSLAAAMAAGLLVIGAGQLWQAWPASQAPTLARLTLSTVDGAAVNLADFRGKPTVLNLWATWCPPCRREMPVFERAQQAWPDVHFVFASQGERPEQVSGWLEREQLTLDNVLIDETRSASLTYGQRGYPTTLFFDATGSLVSVRIGELSAASLGARLAQIAPRPRQRRRAPWRGIIAAWKRTMPVSTPSSRTRTRTPTRTRWKAATSP